MSRKMEQSFPEEGCHISVFKVLTVCKTPTSHFNTQEGLKTLIVSSGALGFPLNQPLCLAVSSVGQLTKLMLQDARIVPSRQLNRVALTSPGKETWPLENTPVKF